MPSVLQSHSANGLCNQFLPTAWPTVCQDTPSCYVLCYCRYSFWSGLAMRRSQTWGPGQLFILLVGPLEANPLSGHIGRISEEAMPGPTSPSSGTTSTHWPATAISRNQPQCGVESASDRVGFHRKPIGSQECRRVCGMGSLYCLMSVIMFP